MDGQDVVRPAPGSALLAALLQRKRATLEELGNLVYVMHERGIRDESRLARQCDALRDLDRQIAAAHARLARPA